MHRRITQLPGGLLSDLMALPPQCGSCAGQWEDEIFKKGEGVKAGFPTSTLPKVDPIKPAADPTKKLMLSPSC